MPFKERGSVVMSCIPGTNEVLVYNNDNESIARKTIEFPPLTANFILNNSAWTNHNNKLYISGGNVSGHPSSLFLCYDFALHQITRLADMDVPRHSHSIISYDDCIYVVGGNENNTCERFDFKTGKWNKINNLFSEERKNPVLHVYNGFLYCFFGMKGNIYLDTVERLSLKTAKAKWEIVAYHNFDNIDLGMIGCGIIQQNDNEILLFGGKKGDEIRDTLIKFNFRNMSFISLSNIDDKVYFHESKFIQIAPKFYAQFSLGKTDHFFRAQIE
jgi:hypothetical protein